MNQTPYGYLVEFAQTVVDARVQEISSRPYGPDWDDSYELYLSNEDWCRGVAAALGVVCGYPTCSEIPYETVDGLLSNAIYDISVERETQSQS